MSPLRIIVKKDPLGKKLPKNDATVKWIVTEVWFRLRFGTIPKILLIKMSQLNLLFCISQPEKRHRTLQAMSKEPVIELETYRQRILIPDCLQFYTGMASLVWLLVGFKTLTMNIMWISRPVAGTVHLITFRIPILT